MSCYITEPLASDSDDEKRIRKAIKESKQLRDEKKRSTAAKSKPKGGVPRHFSERRVILERPVASTPVAGKFQSSRDRCSTCFAVFGQGILPETARQQSPPAGPKKRGKPILNSQPDPSEESMDLYCETLDRNIGSVSVDYVDSFEISSNGNDFNSVIVECEVDRAEQASVTRVKGRLRENIAFWQFIGASQWLLRVLNEGYCLPFIEFPKRMFFRNHNSVFS